MTNYAKVKEHKDLVRDMESKAILNIDTQALMEHRKKKALMREVVNNSNKINQMESDIGEIKQMLLSIIKDRN